MGRLVLRNVNYIDIESGEIFLNKAISINNNIIDSICSLEDYIKLPDDKCYDFDSCWVIPGMIDMHVHLTLPYDYSSDEYYLKPEEILEVSKSNLDELKNIGVTLCRDMGSIKHSAEWVKEFFKNDSLPQILTCGGILTYEKGHMHEYGYELHNENDIKKAIIKDVEVRCDFLKITSDPKDNEASSRKTNPAFSSETLKKIVKLARQNNLDVAIHTYPSKDGVMRALKAGIRTIEHAIAFDEEYGKNIYPESFYVPTLTTAIDVCGLDSLLKKPHSINQSFVNCIKHIWHNHKYKGEIPNSIKEWLDILLKYLPINIKNNENICIGTDAGCKGTDFKSELREIMYLGILGATNHQLLKFAITNPVKALRLHNYGKVEEKYIANLVILSQNPLNNIETLIKNEAVVCSGNMLLH